MKNFMMASYLAMAISSLVLSTDIIADSFAVLPVPPVPCKLTVFGGTGGGSCQDGQTVTIKANPPPSGMSFAGWMGDTAHAADPMASTTTVKMPAKNITLAATYEHLTPCALNLAVRPYGAGSVGLDESPIFAGQTIPLSALPIPGSGFVFVKWVVADASRLKISNPFAAATTACLAADAAITALFAEKQPIAKIAVKLDDPKHGLASVTIAKAALPKRTPFSFDPEHDDVSILVDGFLMELSRTTGVFKKAPAGKVYSYTTNADAVTKIKFALDLDDGQWSLSASKLDGLSKKINIDDGLAVFLLVSRKNERSGVPRAFGDCLPAEMSTAWKHLAGADAAARSHTGGLTVAKSKGKIIIDTSFNAAGKDAFSINGTMKPRDDVEIDPAFDAVEFELDGAWSLAFGIAEASRDKTTGVIKWRGINKTEDGSFCEMEIDLKKEFWKISVTGADLSKVTISDAVTVRLLVGSYEGAASFAPAAKSAIMCATPTHR